MACEVPRHNPVKSRHVDGACKVQVSRPPVPKKECWAPERDTKKMTYLQVGRLCAEAARAAGALEKLQRSCREAAEAAKAANAVRAGRAVIHVHAAHAGLHGGISIFIRQNLVDEKI